MLPNLHAGRAVLGLVLSALVGGAAALLAVLAIVASNAPDDASAVRTGQSTVQDPAVMLDYGQ